jgi:hypothetical protein
MMQLYAISGWPQMRAIKGILRHTRLSRSRRHARPVIANYQNNKPVFAALQDYSPQAFQVRSGIFRDVLRAVAPEG